MDIPEPPMCEGQVTVGHGGAMTDDVGVITGDLTVRTVRRTDHLVAITVQYTGADEWYTLTGSPVPVPAGDLELFHAAVLATIRLGGGAVVPSEDPT